MKKKLVLPLASVALSVLLSMGLSGSMPTHAEALTAKPNIVFILTDDMRKDDLKYMPKTRNLLQEKGTSFRNAFVFDGLCCPSRVTIMRGQYAHNTGVWSSRGPDGGWRTYLDNGLERENVATRLDAAGYRTGLFGKYLNNYESARVPRGWDRWFATWGEYYGYYANDQGTLRHFGTKASAYRTDVESSKTRAFIGNSVAQGKPFFAYVAPKAPHDDQTRDVAVPAPRDRHVYDGLKAPRPPSYNERNVSDKPPWIRQLPRLSADTKANIDKRHEMRAESLQAADDLVAGVVGALREKGVLSNTYVFFTSDNGWHHGEHRIPQRKGHPYEEDVRMPLLVRGPGVAAGRLAQEMALNTDYMPTFTDLACPLSSPCDTQSWSYVPDGRSLRPVLAGTPTRWRSAVLLEAHHTPEGGATPTHSGIRTIGGRKYVEYAGGKKELYSLARDPGELNNRYPAVVPSAELVSRLHALKRCAGDGCRVVEDGP